jgi:small-conductance mechanosensitive channel/predicted nucleic acid-binding protein
MYRILFRRGGIIVLKTPKGDSKVKRKLFLFLMTTFFIFGGILRGEGGNLPQIPVSTEKNGSEPQPTQILKQISPTSPNYPLAQVLVKKIGAISHPQLPRWREPKNRKEYTSRLMELIGWEKKIETLPTTIGELKRKIAVLSSQNDPLSQLQKIYYTKLLENNLTYLNLLKDELPRRERELYSLLSTIDFDLSKIQREIVKIRGEISKITQQIVRQKVDIQKWELLGDPEKLADARKKLEESQRRERELYTTLLQRQLEIWSSLLKKGEKRSLEFDDKVVATAQKIGVEVPVKKILLQFEKWQFGKKVLLYQTKEEVGALWENVKKILNFPLFQISNTTITPITIFLFFVILIAGYMVGRYYKKFIFKTKERYKFSHSTATLLANMGYYTILGLTFLVSLKTIGLDLSSLAIVAGALSVGIGFGLQTIVSNFISGIILMFERTIKVGDYIEIDQNTRGEVVDISMRSTILRTNDNINLIIPNQSFIQNNVINWTMGDDIVRFRIPFGVAYGTPIEKVEEVVLGALEECNIPYIHSHPHLNVTPRVVFLEMGESSLNFELMIWVKGEHARTPRTTRSRFLKLIYTALNRAGIVIPYPQQDLHIVESTTIPIKIVNGDGKKEKG